GVGAALIRALCNRAATEGHSRVGLIVDNINPQAERLYTSLGFKRVGSRQFLGHQMWHLQQELYLSSTELQ
ncbi:MAG: GNAT family N-acetyltransferase, partial [Alistipes sp.]|nr:GNAT family N-acetyltransferase [Alistipes sp.]